MSGMAGKPAIWKPLKWAIVASAVLWAAMTALAVVLNCCTAVPTGVVRVLRWIVGE
ncbi:MAG: hypothetical protein NT031_03405 [Planctomycetota bacterium]|nr:hypothetical protein [Planctomycetota bacterium]